MKEREEPARRIGLFGGTFDPVHTGHLAIAQDAVEQLELNRLIFIPAARSPLKPDRIPAEGRHRLAMLQLAIEDNPSFEVSDMELQRGGISYTVDTVRQIQAERPHDQLFFILGLDSLVDLHRWREIGDLLERCTVVPFARGGDDPQRIAERMELPEPWRSRLLQRLIRIHEIGISSSEIRMRVAEGLGIRYLVPPEVAVYIAEHGLYT